ncbi:hypothetical protein [Cohnella soli]|uniref:Cellobiose phosphorylase n=1 Tax=Cohnella soli TaxID=425005 RepID=A0ABW0HYI5_9BACL
MNKIAILWKDNVSEGTVSIEHADRVEGNILSGHGAYDNNSHRFHIVGPGRLELTITGGDTKQGACATMVSIGAGSRSFSFFLRDVTADYPIYIREYGVIVTEADQLLEFDQVVQEIAGRGLSTHLQRIESEPEETYERAAAATRPLRSPIWLGLSRDVRIFEADFRGMGDSDFTRSWDSVRPRFHDRRVEIPEAPQETIHYHYLLGRGIGCEYRVSRKLEEGKFPIALCTIHDDEIQYDNTAFVSYEASPLNADTLRGTHYLAADQFGGEYMFTPQQREQFEKLEQIDFFPSEETVYYAMTVATNKSRVPRYAWFKSPFPAKIPYEFDGDTGFGLFAADRVFAVSKLNGQPMLQEETAVLLKPGESVTFEFYIPHRPITGERAKSLSRQDFKARHRECLLFWKSKLNNSVEVKLPERRIEEMMQAGLNHLDLICYGIEPEHTVVPAIGIYTAIGSESSPIIQYLDSAGAHGLAERSLQFFLDKQHDNGFMQNFNGYMLETGAALWSIGEHYRYTRNNIWLKKIKPNLVKAYEYLMNWRNRNLREDLVGKGYGMLEGKTADPEDPFRSYMLNGYAYLGLKRLEEILADEDKQLAEQIGRDASQLKHDIRLSFKQTMSRSPVVPLGDGSWVPTCAPWADYRGPVSLYAEGGKWGTHGSMVARDSLLGPLYLVFQEILEPDEQETSFLLNVQSELMCLRNVALSQPYYSIHPWVHLKRGETKAFLKAFYNGLAGLADRETYSFWEHYFHASPHKTHEEGWFLMQCRWMLYMEEGCSLRLLQGIPRAWLEQGKSISLRQAASYFGPFSMQIESDVAHGLITAIIAFHSDRRPEKVEIRLPHPEGKLAIGVIGGTYDKSRETVYVSTSGAEAQVVLQFRN